MFGGPAERLRRDGACERRTLAAPSGAKRPRLTRSDVHEQAACARSELPQATRSRLLPRMVAVNCHSPALLHRLRCSSRSPAGGRLCHSRPRSEQAGACGSGPRRLTAYSKTAHVERRVAPPRRLLLSSPSLPAGDRLGDIRMTRAALSGVIAPPPTNAIPGRRGRRPRAWREADCPDAARPRAHRTCGLGANATDCEAP